jgi:aminopeptidase N
MERIIPINIFVEKGSESKARQSFANVKKFVHAFEYRFGPYQWDKVGYVATNFSMGAMEHATNIAYGAYCNGLPSCEKTLVHEFSHHWFGDLVTCATEKDMWLNEGWASYCEAIYYEYTDGAKAYKDYGRENHKNVLIYAINNPGTFGSLYGMPHSETYGSVVYDKGADIAHTLRGQIGDSLFFTALKNYFQDYAFKDMTVENFRNYLTSKTKIDLTDFFDFWIYAPGFPNFYMNNLNIKKINNKFQLSFNLNQRLLNTDKYLKSSVIEIGALDKSLKLHKFQLKQTGSSSPQKLLLDFEPALLILDPDEKISDATTDEILTIDKPANYDFQSENFNLNVESINSPLFFYCAHHWIKPGNAKLPKNIAKTYDKFWQTGFYSNSGFSATGKFSFYLYPVFGNSSSSSNKENLKLLFRENEDSAWKIIDANPEISASEGTFELKNIQSGQYTIAILK